MMTQHPEDAVSRLQHAVAAGQPVMFPGTWEARTPDAPIEPAVSRGPCGPHTLPAAADDLERLEREREGGGATWERRVGSPATIGEGLRRSIASLFRA